MEVSSFLSKKARENIQAKAYNRKPGENLLCILLWMAFWATELVGIPFLRDAADSWGFYPHIEVRELFSHGTCLRKSSGMVLDSKK